MWILHSNVSVSAVQRGVQYSAMLAGEIILQAMVMVVILCTPSFIHFPGSGLVLHWTLQSETQC